MVQGSMAMKENDNQSEEETKGVEEDEGSKEMYMQRFKYSFEVCYVQDICTHHLIIL